MSQDRGGEAGRPRCGIAGLRGLGRGACHVSPEVPRASRAGDKREGVAGGAAMGRRPDLQEEVGILWAEVSMETGREVPVHNPGLLELQPGGSRPRLRHRYVMAGPGLGRGGERGVGMGDLESGRGEECGGGGAGCGKERGCRGGVTAVPIHALFHGIYT